jgi:hypothetical protein
MLDIVRRPDRIHAAVIDVPTHICAGTDDVGLDIGIDVETDLFPCKNIMEHRIEPLAAARSTADMQHRAQP